MIFFLGSPGHSYTLHSLKKGGGSPIIRYCTYDRWIGRSTIPPGTYIFGDLDRLSPWTLELASHLFIEIQRNYTSVLNNPATVMLRFELLRALHRAGINSFNAWRCTDLVDLQFPLFVRREFGHGRPCTDLLRTRVELDTAIARLVSIGVPLRSLIAIQYWGEPVRGNVFRRCSLLKVGSNYVVCPNVHERNWCVKYGETGCSPEELYEEEEALFSTPVNTNPLLLPVTKAFELANINYGRADFGIVNGRPEIYEINTNPHIGLTISGNKSPARERIFRRYCHNIVSAFHSIDAITAGEPLKITDNALLGESGLKRFIVRSRSLPRSC